MRQSLGGKKNKEIENEWKRERKKRDYEQERVRWKMKRTEEKSRGNGQNLLLSGWKLVILHGNRNNYSLSSQFPAKSTIHFRVNTDINFHTVLLHPLLHYTSWPSWTTVNCYGLSSTSRFPLNRLATPPIRPEQTHGRRFSICPDRFWQ